jgi:arginine exporter protein ArgO
MNAFWQGVIAGYGIAIPVGAIAVLIIDLALRRGFRPGFAAGAGAASADWIYAGLAVAAGTALAVALRPFALWLAFASGGVLVALGMSGVWRVWRARPASVAPEAVPTDGRSLRLVYLQFLGLTLLNPLTVVYFAALVLGGSLGSNGTPASGLLFMLGAGLASLSWQTLLAGIGSLLGKRLPPRARLITSLVGNMLVIALGVRILIQAQGGV